MINQSQLQDLPEEGKREITKKYELRSHLDSVRGIEFISAIDALASVSEDCTVKLWSIRSMVENENQLVEPYITLRGHTGPIFTAEKGC